MRECKPVSIPKTAFLFCKHVIFILMLLSLVFQAKWLILLSFLLLLGSAVLKIERAPLVYMYTKTIHQRFPSPNIILDEHAMRFTHTLGAILTGICSLLLYRGFIRAGWIMTGIVTIISLAGSMGYRFDVKLYNCLNYDNLRRFITLVKLATSRENFCRFIASAKSIMNYDNFRRFITSATKNIFGEMKRHT